MGLVGDKIVLESRGYCPICDSDQTFRSYSNWLRDNFVCLGCESIPRERALIATLNLFFPQWRSQSIHECSPALRASEKIRRECADYTATQFDPALGFGNFEFFRNYRSEDLESQTFDDKIFDLVVTQDVFEHLFRPDLAIAEIARTLRPGGAHVCTVPITRQNSPTVPRARREADGKVTHLFEPIYHGNPISSSGSLVTYDYGYDIADLFDKCGELNTTIIYIDDINQGIRAQLNEVLVSRKNMCFDFLSESAPPDRNAHRPRWTSPIKPITVLAGRSIRRIAGAIKRAF